VFLPYWASTLDDVMDNPVNSILWTPEYFGNGDGIVYSGPAAGWSTMQGGLERDYGRFSTLLKRDQIQKVLTQCRLAVSLTLKALNIVYKVQVISFADTRKKVRNIL
jgi:hypothetical protein